MPLDLAADVDIGLSVNSTPLDLAADAWWCVWSCAGLRHAGAQHRLEYSGGMAR
jgi:hypothetical protein